MTHPPVASFIAPVISLGPTHSSPAALSSTHLLRSLGILIFFICGCRPCIALVLSWLPCLLARASICSHIILMSCPVRLLKGTGVLQGIVHSFQKLSQVSCPLVIYQVSLNFCFFFFCLHTLANSSWQSLSTSLSDLLNTSLKNVFRSATFSLLVTCQQGLLFSFCL